MSTTAEYNGGGGEVAVVRIMLHRIQRVVGSCEWGQSGTGWSTKSPSSSKETTTTEASRVCLLRVSVTWS